MCYTFAPKKVNRIMNFGIVEYIPMRGATNICNSSICFRSISIPAPTRGATDLRQKLRWFEAFQSAPQQE
ncbi:hypothetical protein AC241_31620 (plasmid) [Bacillus thuringiensis]|nr:hypothetical protein AC241_31620 [Bacillus thuringiensis]